MFRRNMIALSLVSAMLVAGCDAIGAAKSVAVDAARDQLKSEIEQVVSDVVASSIDIESFLPQAPAE